MSDTTHSPHVAPAEGSQLTRVERWTAVLALVVIAAAWIATSRPVSLGVTLGAGLMVLNTWAMRRIGQRVIRAYKRPGAAILLLNLKMALLLGLVYVVVRYLPINAIGFIVGISVFPVAVVIAAVQGALRPGPDSSTDDPAGER